jgi:poly[(R)-3-hydroxyalkanoate] polymerase subunit PhaC
VAVVTEKATRGEERDQLDVPATGLLGPNPFVGLRAGDLMATAQQIAVHAVAHPALLVDRKPRSRGI